MRLLHTADWHLGDRLGRIDRTADIRRAVETVAQCCRDERVDVLIVAGDIFSEMIRPDGLRDAVAHLRSAFGPFLQSGGTILAITGNHDNETFCQTLRHAMSLAAPDLVQTDSGVAVPGRLYLAAEPAMLKLADRTSGSAVQFLLMPYPSPAVYFTGESGRRYASLAEKNDRLRAAFLERLAGWRSDPRYDAVLPTVLVAHVGLSSADLSTRFRLTPESDIVLDEPSWFADYAYVALGHVHKPQAISRHEHVRYCGSIERLDLGEANDSKCVAIADIGRSGLQGRPIIKPLPSTPVYHVNIDDVTDLERVAAQFGDRAEALVNVYFSYDAARDDLLEVQKRIDAAFPRWYARDWHNRSEMRSTAALSETSAQAFECVVRDFLIDKLASEPEDERAALLALADHYLQEPVRAC